MTRNLIVRRSAEIQASRARDWYESQLDNLGRRFVVELDHAIQKAHENPPHYQPVHREIRRVLLRSFPYAVFFISEPRRVVVLAILHQYEDP
ncbi:MAG: type II toxin-antitoxin system RelE/ParE family toxin, partial [Acidobacteriota bacterium]